jgi:hypothetical protein
MTMQINHFALLGCLMGVIARVFTCALRLFRAATDSRPPKHESATILDIGSISLVDDMILCDPIKLNAIKIEMFTS